MSYDYSEHLYIERDVDHSLWETTRKWLGSSQIQWVSLKTAPGMGNTWLLEHLQNLIQKHEAGFSDIAVIPVKSPLNETTPGLGPLGQELYDRYTLSRVKLWKRAKRVVREVGPVTALGLSLLAIAALLAVFVLKGVSEYIKLKDWRQMTWATLWSGFANDFFPRHWHSFPIWFFTDWSVSVPITVSVLVYSYWRRKRKKKTAVADDEESKYFQSRAELAMELTEICWRSRGVILLIDDAHRLRNDEKQVLIDLVNPVKGSALQEFTAKHRVLIITIESQYISWEGRRAEHTLTVPQFTRLELNEIADRQLSIADEDARKHQDELVEQAQENIKALFAHREQQLIDALGKEFSGLESKSFEVTFNVAELMAYVAVLQMRAVRSGELVEALESPASKDHFAAFGYRPVADSARLLEELRNTSTLVQQVRDRVVYFDVLRCRALRLWLKNGDHSQLLAQAHLFWFRHYTYRALKDRKRLKRDEVRDLSFPQQVNLKSAAWHAAQIGVLLDSAPQVLQRASSLNEQQRGELSRDIAALMLGTAIIYADEGNLTEANDLVVDALEWVREYKHPEQSELVDGAVALLWRHYWFSGNPLIRERLQEVPRDFPDLSPPVTKSICERVNRRFEEMLQSQEKLSSSPAKTRIKDPVLININRLTEILWQIRKTHGLVEPALKDTTLEIPDPVVAKEFNAAEFQLRQLQIAAWTGRGVSDRLEQGLKDWRQRLEETKPIEGVLGSEVTYLLQTARYWHTLAEIYRVESERNDELEEGQEEAIEKLQALIVDACLKPPSEEADLQQIGEYIWKNARSAYERALQIAALLDWQVPLLEACFHFGVLLEEYTPQNEQTELPPWWQRWDEQLFRRAIELEKDLHWIFHTPEIHLTRWEFFAEKDHEHSVEDAFNAYQSAKRAHYPIKLVLRWHQQVSSTLTNFGDSDLDRRRCAELHEEWAHELAQLNDVPKPEFKRLEYEQANSLHFAAQARRILKEFDACERLLNEAEQLVAKAQQEESDTEEPQSVRNLRQGLKLQRAWMFNGQNRDEEYKAAVFELWSGLRIKDESCAIVLNSLLSIERAMKLLDCSWPAIEDEAPHIDPANADLSLPAEWFAGTPQIHLRNRFEFRFFQLLNLINFVARSTPARSYFSPDPERVFAPFALHSAAIYHWFGCNNYGEVVLRFGRVGMEFISGETQAKEYLIRLLVAVQFYFSQVQQVDRDELEALQLLMHYEPSDDHRVRYAQVLAESKYLLERELLAREAAEEPNWLAIANKVNRYLSVLVDATLQSNWINMGLQQTGMSPEQFLSLKTQRVEALVEAKARFDSGELGACRQLLKKVLPSERNPWIFLEDLQIFDLWLRCATAQDMSAHANGDLNKYTTALRKGTEQFIRQFGLTIREIEGQRLATQLLDSIQGRTRVPGGNGN